MYYITRFNLDTLTICGPGTPIRDFKEAQDELKGYLRDRIYKYLGRQSLLSHAVQDRRTRTAEIYQEVINSPTFRHGASLLTVPFYTFEGGYLKYIPTSFWITDNIKNGLTGEVWNITNQVDMNPLCMTL